MAALTAFAGSSATTGEVRPVSVDAVVFKQPDPGLLFVQILYDKQKDQSFVVVAHANETKAEVLNVVGPVKDLRDWGVLYDKMAVFAKSRPGGYFCSGAASPCTRNVLVSDPRAQQLAMGRAPTPPPHPPPPSDGVMTEMRTLTGETTGPSAATLEAAVRKVAALEQALRQ